MNKKISPFKLANEEDDLRPTQILKLISAESEKFQINKRQGQDFQFLPKMKQREYIILSYLKKKTDHLNYFKNKREKELNQNSQYAEGIINKKRCFSNADSRLVNFNYDSFLFGNYKNYKIDSSNHISDLYSFSCTRQKKCQTSKNLDSLRTTIDYYVTVPPTGNHST